ncbi:MAG: hypothetical protein K6G33_11855 [Ruminococcus sp.]|uniref:hypothetical protein n=1 Tax=Ruminococcus sp. TaxID=41978 RepID=UPI0025DEFB05|nr:hypothetical protein [Ruminococcus sp.]MCR5601420.1 hypothetical protein [Ruminococcus sp.]
MQKPNALRITQITAALFCVAKLALDIFFIMNNHFSLHTLFFGDHITAEGLPTEIKITLITEALIVAAPIGILSAVNYVRLDMKHNRGIVTLLLAGVLYIINITASIIIDRISFSLITTSYGAGTAAMTASINSIRSFTSFLVTAAFIMVFCCAAIEIYAGKTPNKNGMTKGIKI